MSDLPSPREERKERDFRASVGLAVLGLEIIGYGLLTWFGDPTNAMHTSA